MREPVTLSGSVPPPTVNVANAITVLRLLLVPVFAGCVVVSDFDRPGWQVMACLVFLLASVTDYVDGWLARSRNLVTPFGKLADPIADKALTGTALVLLSVWEKLPWWVTIVILVRELGITALRLWVVRFGVIAASRGGKWKTAVQILAIAWYLWPWPDSVAGAAPWLMGLAVAITLVTGFDYVARVIAVRRNRART